MIVTRMESKLITNEIMRYILLFSHSILYLLFQSLLVVGQYYHLIIYLLNRYVVSIAQGVIDLHNLNVMCENIHFSNILLDEKGHAILSEYVVNSMLKHFDITVPRCPNYLTIEMWGDKSLNPSPQLVPGVLEVLYLRCTLVIHCKQPSQFICIFLLTYIL